MYIIGAVIEKECSKVALYDKEYRHLLSKKGSAEDFSKLCMDTVSEMNIKTSDVDYIGVAVDGCFGTPDFVAAELEKNIGIKCYGASLMEARALGESFAMNDVPHLFMLKVDDTVESGVVIENKIYSGAYRFGGNVAHMSINFDGIKCTCGRRGCFESYASNSGLKRIATESGIVDTEELTHKKLFEMDTPEAEQAQKRYVEYLANGITSIINLFQPSELVLEGPFTEVGDKLMNPLMEIILREQYTHSMDNKCNIRFSNKDVDTSLIGAALLGR